MATIYDCTPSRTLLTSAATTVEVKVADFFKRLFSLWMSGLAAFTFVGALLLATARFISWSSVGYVYLSITIVTLLLAAFVYATRSGEGA